MKAPQLAEKSGSRAQRDDKSHKKWGGVLFRSILQSFISHWGRFWRLSEVRLLFLSLLISVISVTSVGFFTDRAERAMSAQATQLLGGDLVIISTRPMGRGYLEEAKKQGIKTAETITFPSMVSMGEAFQLVQVKVVSTNYPLQGEIELSQRAGRDDNKPNTFDIKSLDDNTAIAEPRLFNALNAKPSDKIQLGQSKIKLAGVIQKLPDQTTNVFQVAPILILPKTSLAQTRLLSEASRASYSYYFAGDDKVIASFKGWLKPRLQSQERLRTLDDGLPSVQQALQRGQRFLKMAALLAVILAGAGIALSSFSLTQHETPSVAVLKTLGASRKQVLIKYLGQLFLIATLAALIGSLAGYLIQILLANTLQDFVGGSLPPASWRPVWVGALTAWIMALGFSAPQLMLLVTTAPVQIFQGQTHKSKLSFLFSFVALSSSVLMLMCLQTGDFKLSIYLLLGVLLALLVFWLIALLMLALLRKLGERWRLPKTNRRMALMVVVFGVGLFSLLLLTSLRSDLISRWQASLPQGAPNHFLINIQPDEVKNLRSFIQAKLGIAPENSPLYPMVLGRLVAINNKPVSPDDPQFNNPKSGENNHRAQRLLAREFNLSATEKPPEGNKIIKGKWFDKQAIHGLSVEQGIAKTFKLNVGDSLTFDIAGQKITEKITSLRSVQWDSMKPNFFVLLAPHSIKNFHKTYITSLNISDDKRAALPRLIQQFPSVTDIDISAILKQVRDLINKAAFAVQSIFLFTLVSGIVVLFAALQSQKALRRREIAILKSLGASHAYLRRNLLIEFIMIGALAGFMASVLALVAANIAAYALFDLSPEVNFGLVLSGTLIGATLVGAAGYLNVRGLLTVSPVSLFR